MKVEVTVYTIYNAEGEYEGYDVVKESSDNICLNAVDKDGKRHQFDSTEAYHVHSWAAQHGFTIKTTTKEVEIEG